jgi:tetratricopeptide (TPR) repeat protein
MSSPNPKNPGKNPQPAGRPNEPKGPAAGKSPPPEAPPAHVIPLYRRIDWISFTLTTVAVLLGYWWTLAPDLTLEDCGELAVASMYAGVPHPPGYPVWAIYSWLFTLLPIENIAYRVALSSAVAGALSCGLVALMVSRGSSMIVEGIAELKSLPRKWENGLCLVSGLVAGLLIGFNGFMWSQAVIVEVYTLSVLSMTLVLVFLLRWIYAPHQRRYLYWAFFWFGICFNNHQSLLVLALGLEVAILAVSPKMGRALFLWNVIIYVGGLIGKNLGMIGTLEGNTPLMLVYHFVGISSAAVFIWLWVRTKWTAVEAARDGFIVLVLIYVVALVLSLMNWVTTFKYADTLDFKVPQFFLFNTVGIGLIAGLVYFIRQARPRGTDWAAALGCGLAWIVGAAFYFYMPLASMSNPPLNWGYPRTVTGFFHALTRGQYERIHPTLGQALDQGPDGRISQDLGRFFYQIGNYIGGTLEEFNLVYVLIAILPFLFLGKMQKRERAWMIGLAATYLTLSLFLLNLLNPAPDRQSRDLNRVFFTASHFMVAMGIGYGLTIIGAYLITQYERWKKYCLIGSMVSAGLALFILAVTFQGETGIINFHTPVFDLNPSFSPLERFTDAFGLLLALGALAILMVSRTQLAVMPMLVLFALLPFHSILSHWSDNEQRGHYFGYWFGHDMFTPPFKDPKTGKPLYPEMARDTVLYGGTDPGRFNPTYMIFCESFIPPSKRNPRDPNFDRRDVYLITQNALADGTYLNYIRAHYNRSAQIDPPFFSELFRGPKELEIGKTNIIACMMRPLDSIFLSLGDRIEKKRRAGTSFFEESHFTDIGAMAKRLQNPSDPALRFIADHLSKETQQLLGGGRDNQLRTSLAKDLNALLELELNNKAAWEELLEQRSLLTQQMTSLSSAVQSAQNPPTADPAAVQRAKENLPRLEAELARVRTELPQVEQKLKTVMFYHPERFQGINLSARTKRFAAQEPRSHTRIRLNRILLEEIFPTEIRKTLGGVYPDMEILSATNDDSQKSFQDYLADAQRRLEHDRRFPNEPKQIRLGEDVKIIENKVQVSGQVAVMAINALLTKVIFDKNPDHEFYVEESFPLEWMYPHLTPFGIIMKINRNPVPELTQEMLDTDHEFWSQFAGRLIGTNVVAYDTPISNICAFAEQVYYRKKKPANFTGDPRFLRDNDGQKAFSKLRSSIAGVYAWRIQDAIRKNNQPEYQRMLKEAEFAFKQAYAFCPYSPEAIFRYINILITTGRVDDAILMAVTSQKLDPFNAQIQGLIFELRKIKASMAGQPANDVASMEEAFAKNPKDVSTAYQLVSRYAQVGQMDKIVSVLDQLTANGSNDPSALMMAANFYGQLGQLPKAEKALQQLVKIAPQHAEGAVDLAAIQVMQSKSNLALQSLRTALDENAKRHAGDGSTPNLYSNVLADQRFASLRGWTEFDKLLGSYQPKP